MADHLEEELMDLMDNGVVYLPQGKNAINTNLTKEEKHPPGFLEMRCLEYTRNRHSFPWKTNQKVFPSSSFSSSNSSSCSSLNCSSSNSSSNLQETQQFVESMDVFQRLRKEYEERCLLKSKVYGRKVSVSSHLNDNLEMSTRDIFNDHSMMDNSIKQLFSQLSPIEKSILAREADTSFERNLKNFKNSKEIIERHFEAIFETYSVKTSLLKSIHHSLGCVLFDFASLFHQLYDDVLQTDKEDEHPKDKPSCHRCHSSSSQNTNDYGTSSKDSLKLKDAVEDVRTFGKYFLRIVLYKYPFLDAFHENVARCINIGLFTHLQPTLHGLYRQRYVDEDGHFLYMCISLSELSSAEIGIRDLFRLDSNGDSSTISYQTAISLMNTFASARSSIQKLEIMALAIQEMDACIKRYHNQHQLNDRSSDTINVATNELIPIVAFVLLHSTHASQYTKSYTAILDDFIPEYCLLREEGFALAVFHTAQKHIELLFNQSSSSSNNSSSNNSSNKFNGSSKSLDTNDFNSNS